MTINTSTFSGNVGKDPEIRYFDSGKSVTTFSLAVQQFTGNQDKKSFWMPCKAFSKLGETICELVKKGNLVTVTGRIEEETWTQNNEQKRKFVLIVSGIQFPRKPKEEEVTFPYDQNADIPF